MTSRRLFVAVAVFFLLSHAPTLAATRPRRTPEPGQPADDRGAAPGWQAADPPQTVGAEVLSGQAGVWDRYKVYIVGAITVAVLQSALIAVLLRQRARYRCSERALLASQAELRQSYEQNRDLASRLINAQESERTRIARDLHDDLSQQIAGIAILLSGLRRKAARANETDTHQMVVDVQERVSTLAQVVRVLSHELHPALLRHTGLVSTLKRLCADSAQMHRLEITFNAEGAFDAIEYDVALCVFRVAQEAISNAVRHAKATTIRVELADVAPLRLRVTDDGVGFVPAEATGKGLGLRSMEERVRLIRGELRVDSLPGSGTTVLVSIPPRA